MSSSFVVAFLADFAPESDERPRSVSFDRDDLETRMAGWAPTRACSELGGSSLKFRSHDDFTPDRIISQLPRLSVWLEAAEAAGSLEQVQALLREAGESTSLGEAETSSPPDSPRPSAPRAVSEADVLEAILEGGESTDEIRLTPESRDPELGRAIDAIVGSVGERPLPADAKARRRHLQDELATRLRHLLHDAGFARLEAAWSGLRDVARDVPTSIGVRLVAVDCDLESTSARLEDAADSSDLSAHLSGLAAHPGSDPVRLVLIDRSFEDSPEDWLLLEHLGRVAKKLGATAIAGAGASLIAAAERPDWDARRRHPGLESIALAWPRILVRAPYGPSTEPVECFPFEEIQDGSVYSWGNAVYVVARMLLRGHAELQENPEAHPEAVLTGLPIHVTPERVVGPMEELVTVDRLAALAKSGFLPIAGFVNDDRIALGALRTLAGAPLFG